VTGAGPGSGGDRPDGTVLAVFAHPDDAELAAGGTLAKWAAAGRGVHLLVLTDGDRGSLDAAADRARVAEVRGRETVEGARELGLAGATVLDVHDGELEDADEVRAAVVREIRRLRPEIVLTCDPTTWFLADRYVNHPDHRTAGAIALAAVFPAAGNPHYFPEQLAEGLGPHDARRLWLAWTTGANHREDVGATFETKVAALGRHASQLADGIRYFETALTREAEIAGAELGVRYAEAFRVLELD
jgi:LmbE family N-acetylglucosaminyl deacetylase